MQEKRCQHILPVENTLLFLADKEIKQNNTDLHTLTDARAFSP